MFKKRLKEALLLSFSFWTYFRNWEYKANVLVSLFPFKKKVETNSQDFSLIGFWVSMISCIRKVLQNCSRKMNLIWSPEVKKLSRLMWSKETPFYILSHKGLRHMWTSHFIYTAHWFKGVFLIRILVFNELRLTLLSQWVKGFLFEY